MAFHMLQFESLFLPSSHFDYFLEVHNSSKDFGRKRLWLSGQGTRVAALRSQGQFPVGMNFQTGLKKIPSPLHMPKRWLRPCPAAPGTHMGLWPLCRGGRGVRGVCSACMRRSSS
jgi:hypothetical protein